MTRISAIGKYLLLWGIAESIEKIQAPSATVILELHQIGSKVTNRAHFLAKSVISRRSRPRQFASHLMRQLLCFPRTLDGAVGHYSKPDRRHLAMIAKPRPPPLAPRRGVFASHEFEPNNGEIVLLESRFNGGWRLSAPAWPCQNLQIGGRLHPNRALSGESWLMLQSARSD
jgi:hypothetical protein